jgi:hypothetical protein
LNRHFAQIIRRKQLILANAKAEVEYYNNLVLSRPNSNAVSHYQTRLDEYKAKVLQAQEDLDDTLARVE